jgi:hypothetical protein
MRFGQKPSILEQAPASFVLRVLAAELPQQPRELEARKVHHDNTLRMVPERSHRACSGARVPRKGLMLDSGAQFATHCEVSAS